MLLSYISLEISAPPPLLAHFELLGYQVFIHLLSVHSSAVVVCSLEFNIYLFIFVCGCVCAPCAQKEARGQVLKVGSPPTVCSWDWIQVVQFGNKHLSHWAISLAWNFNFQLYFSVEFTTVHSCEYFSYENSIPKLLRKMDELENFLNSMALEIPLASCCLHKVLKNKSYPLRLVLSSLGFIWDNISFSVSFFGPLLFLSWSVLNYCAWNVFIWSFVLKR